MRQFQAIALPFLTCLAVFLTLDGLWLGVIGGSLYTSVLGELMLDGFRLAPAVLFYLLHIAAIMVFVLPPARQRNSLTAAVAFGAFYGICAYGTYDLTNQAVLRVWTTQLTVIDMAWGGFVTASASLAGAWVDRRMRARR